MIKSIIETGIKATKSFELNFVKKEYLDPSDEMVVSVIKSLIRFINEYKGFEIMGEDIHIYNEAVDIINTFMNSRPEFGSDDEDYQRGIDNLMLRSISIRKDLWI